MEMLVVLAIIGVMGATAVIGLGGAGRGESVQAEAQRLASSIQLAADEAMVTGRPLALNWDDEGYAFVQWNMERGAWESHGAPDLGTRHELPGEMSLAGDSEQAPVTIGGGFATGPIGFTLSGDSQSWRVQFDGLNAAAAANG